jgi:hypothetical protein
MRLEIPAPLKAEHESLHRELVSATRAGGRTAEVAETVARLLHPHFVKEEEYALPPLGLLVAVAGDRVTPDMSEVVPMTEKLKADLDHMLEEHKDVVAALQRLIGAAAEESKPEVELFAKKLIEHVQTEEKVMYPAAILVGEYVRLKLRGMR